MGTETTSLIFNNNSSDDPRSSGIIPNFERLYFINLAVKYVSEVNAMIDHH